MVNLKEKFEEARKLEATNVDQAIAAFTEIINTQEKPSDKLRIDEIIKLRENSIYRVGQLYVNAQQAENIAALLRSVRSLFAGFPKAKTAKIVKTLLDYTSKVPNTINLQIGLCEEFVEWCRQEKRTFLRQRIETKLAMLYAQQEQFTKAIEFIERLLREVKKLDDKGLLVEIHLIESKVYFALLNFPKSKAALTAARTNANSIYCPPILQAEIDLMSGILNAQEKDYKTGYSYFYESFEAFDTSSDARAVTSLKYMLLAKIMNNQSRDINGILAGKTALKYTGNQIDSITSVADAHKKRSLLDFQKALDTYENELKKDDVIKNHLDELYDNMLEQNLIRIVEPYSKVELTYVAQKISLELTTVQAKLSEMILDKKILGTLDQGNDCLILFEEEDDSEINLYNEALKTMGNIDNVVNSLGEKVRKIKIQS
mmetsp:Transcript_54222/g.62095  ORF Transcript_54222/g.62095 Transcript_54222/m.62095 type:complete len:430 (+) Transcript_54222:52-1341(+)|eukprot:CAMPEP_0114998242 /NCGR_PEP_ID=MMETSP0216-20121206/15381_1 /TAXON_ID=223996 /ORGANISM="Protocruzia adherens, Strain Boccale" /LENGTH=429 /DNA_ID=CAMNT_0002362783 /DNA_START=37 /DNA_END=1326 /DNA_ORIENTATION=+